MATMLVVDDDRQIVRLLSDFLRVRGHEVYEAGNGMEALCLARTQRFDVVFLDIVMPQMDGNDTLRLLRSDSPETVVIMISGTSDQEVAIRALDLGAFDYVMKPFDLQHLESVVLNGLAMRS
ncbi:MAG TPA: response regulator [Candidatus Polarisedimenticolia bacterium]|nr:response regulator [Candidatus Polarisedimenticolia bacterium]